MENIGFDVAETARLMRRDFDRRAAALGVTRAQWRVLVRLAGEAGMRQVDLAEAIDVEPITLCRMIDRLEDAGLVERRRDDVDRRAWNLHLTDKAEPLIGKLHILGQAFQAAALAGISATDQKRAQDVLARIRANLAGSGAAAGRRAS